MTSDAKFLIDYIKHQTWCLRSNWVADGNGGGMLAFVTQYTDGAERRCVLDDAGSFMVTDDQEGPSLKLTDSLLEHLRRATSLPLSTVRYEVPRFFLNKPSPAEYQKQQGLRIAAENVLRQWLDKQYYPGMVEALLPQMALAALSDTDGMTIAKTLSALLPDERVAFVDRFEIAHPGFAATWDARDTSEAVTAADTAHDVVTTFLQRLWPQWAGWHSEPREFSYTEYVYCTATNTFLDVITPQQLGARALDASVQRWPTIMIKDEDGKFVEAPAQPSTYLRNRDHGLLVDAVSSLPGYPRIVNDHIVDRTGLLFHARMRTFNMWRPGPPVDPNAPDAGQWLDLVKRLWPVAVHRERFLDTCAFAVQQPGEPINGVIVMVGEQGVGKDAVLYPVMHSVGMWNTATISPAELVARFNPWVASRIVNINESRLDFREGGAHGFYAALKSYSTTPPDTVGLDDKGEKVRWVLKRMVFFVTSNELAGFYVPDDDRRYLINQSDLVKGWHIRAGLPNYFVDLFDWYGNGMGLEAVHRYLAERDISHFDPMSPMPHSVAKAMAQAITREGDTVLSAALNKLGNPDIFFGGELLELATQLPPEFSDIKRLLNRSPAITDQLRGLGYSLFIDSTNAKREWVFQHTPLQGSPQRVRSRRAYVRTEVARAKAPADIEAALTARGHSWAFYGVSRIEARHSKV